MSSSTPSTVQVRPHPTKGRALHAAKDFQPGDIILSLTPLLLLPSLPFLSSLCTYCLRPSSPRACSRCHAAYYCNATCQAAAWTAIHSRECKVLRQNLDERQRAELPTPVRALIQTLLSKDVQTGLQNLEAHMALRRAGMEWEGLQLMAMGASAYAGKGTTLEALQKACELLSKIEMNSFSRVDTDLGITGMFLEPTLAMANHSCTPNALVQFIGRKVYLRAGQSLQAGDEIEIAYTGFAEPLSKRKQALSLYKFTCQCPRCKDDLNVYQVAAAFPNLGINSFSLVTDLSKFRQHPALNSPGKQTIARTHCKTSEVVESPMLADTPSMWRMLLQEEYDECAQLVKEELWAVSPLPELLTGISVYYVKQENIPFALAISCLFATACDPYQYVAPFHPMRLVGLLTIAKLLSNTAADTASLNKSLKSMAVEPSLDQKVQEKLQEIDQVSLCQMLLIMILWSTPAVCAADWDIAVRARDMLNDIDRLSGREKELSLIDEWKRDPKSDQSKAFFEYAVVQQVDALANLGRAVLKLDFKGQS
ncbi:Histone-lysine N-methyltransferase ASHR1-like protein [Cladobotryum mycophilum]|uniref:Histone-lysine N-methyltransferase ASHR1-like protein n=1 Tax=Cladobotryum mycophilum TaxID=491253 RepID=A0ABR0S5E2_9HYPO